MYINSNVLDIIISMRQIIVIIWSMLYVLLCRKLQKCYMHSSDKKRYKSETWVKFELFHQFINHPEECCESTYPGVITIGPWSRPKWLLDYFLTKYAHGRTFAEYEASCISFAVQGKTTQWQKTLLWVTKGQGRIFFKGVFSRIMASSVAFETSCDVRVTSTCEPISG